MAKTKITETTEKYDKDGKLVEKITREETSEDDTSYVPTYPNPNFNGMVVHTNPPYYSYCGQRENLESNFGGRIETGTVPYDRIKTGEITERLDFSGLKNKGETTI